MRSSLKVAGFLVTFAVGVLSNVLRYKVTENATAGYLLTKDLRKDLDLPSKLVRFILHNSQEHDDLYIDNVELRLKEPIDRDKRCPNKANCKLSSLLSYSEIDPSRNIANGKEEWSQIEVELLDINDNRPEFNKSLLKLNISENISINSSIELIEAKDNDSPQFSIRSYNMTPSYSEYFDLIYENGKIPQLRVKKILDRDNSNIVWNFTFYLTATDGRNWARCKVNIIVQDENDEKPVFEQSSYTVEVREETSVNSSIYRVKAFDNDAGPLNSLITYSLHGDSDSTFDIDKKSGKISLKKKLDFEVKEKYELIIAASDSGEKRKTAKSNLLVKVLNVDDEPPEIYVNRESLRPIVEGVQKRTFVFYIRLDDVDSPKNSSSRCRVNDTRLEVSKVPEYPYLHQVDSVAEFDREATPFVSLSLICSDVANNKATHAISVDVLDVNDCSPKFEKDFYKKTIDESIPIGMTILTVKAIDKDEGENGTVNYRLTGEGSHYFSIDKSGRIMTREKFDVDHANQRNLGVDPSSNSLTLSIVAADNGKPSRNSSVDLHIRIIDVDDNPVVFDSSSYVFRIQENFLPNKVPLGQVKASDADQTFNKFKYTMKTRELENLFFVDSKSGEIELIKKLDREKSESYVLVILAESLDGPSTATTTVTVKVLDTNDNAPEFLFPPIDHYRMKVFSSTEIGTKITRLEAEDIDGEENFPLIFEAVSQSPFFEITHDGYITVKESLSNLINETVELRLTVRDSGTPRLRSNRTLELSIIERNALPSQLDQSSKRNLIIVICVASLSTVVIIFLLAAILNLLKRRRHRGTPKFDAVLSIRDNDENRGLGSCIIHQYPNRLNHDSFSTDSHHSNDGFLSKVRLKFL
ncbi:unnamed protein product [Dimorphilus gyrociliatus]|uniref:Cadherin domain-containing protein n=1 Tax=Dimorphilus gyrociliatus TaxID=2664684 RepID=A0A7I8VDZ7_9ANNE|nr:unnamed protein product [Dimorphilus gyrociliatus]